MPVISTFFGIVIRMFYREHGVAHFHAEYQGQQATFTLDGEDPRRCPPITDGTAAHRGMGASHRVELEANWHRAKAGEPLERIEPLD